MNSNIKIETFIGENVEPYIPEIAKLRIEVFRDWPYLYDGDLENEKKYLKKFSNCSESVFVVAFDGKKVIGIASGLPLWAESDIFLKPFLDNGIDVNDYFYCSESLLKKNYRRQGIGHMFFDKREAHAKSYGKYSHLCFCAVQRDKNDPRKPEDHYQLDSFWAKRGFEKQPNLVVNSSWKEIGASEKSVQSLAYWIKKIL